MDFNGWTLRRNVGEGTETLYGCTGTPPVTPLQTFDWSWPPTSRTSLPIERPLLGSAWADWVKETGSWSFKVNHGEGIETQINARDALSSFLAARIHEYLEHSSILAVPNRLSESKQEELLRALKAKGCKNVILIWRPIALALCALENEHEALAKCKRVIVVDADGPQCEITLLHLISHEGNLIPERGIPKSEDHNIPIVNRQSILCKMLPTNADLDAANLSAVVEQLEQNYSEVNIPFVAASQWKVSTRNNGESFRSEKLDPLLKSIEKVLKNIMLFSGDAAVIFHGWPFQYIKPPSALDGQLSCIRSSSDAVVKGAEMHLEGRNANRTTYFDTIPGLYLPTKDRKTKQPLMNALVPRQRVQGGSIIKKTFPTRFFFSSEKPEISIYICRGGDEKWRKLSYRLEQPSGQKIQVKISSEIASGQGTTKVFIEEVTTKQSTASKFSIVLDWDIMDEVKPIFDSSPSYWPIPGRIFDKDKVGLSATNAWLKQTTPTINSRVQFYGTQTPFGTVLNKSKQFLIDPSRGLLGSDYRDNDEEILSVIERLTSEIYRQCKGTPKLAKFLNYLYVYAPYQHREDIRSIFREKDAMLVSSWNHAYAPGYQFSSSDDFNLFLDWIEHQSQPAGFPMNPETSYTQKYFWSCFRCLCYFPDTILVGSEKIKQLLLIMISYIESMYFPQNQDEKFLLCLILFSLRIREIEPDFLNPSDALYEQLIALMVIGGDLHGVKFPPVMLQQANNKDNLTDFVLRFLRREPTAADLKALEGLSLGV